MNKKRQIVKIPNTEDFKTVIIYSIDYTIHDPQLTKEEAERGKNNKAEDDPSLQTKRPIQTQEQQEPTNPTVEEPWTVVARRGKRQSEQQQTLESYTGTGNELQAVEKKTWIFLERLRKETTAETVKKFLTKRESQGT